VSDKSAFLKDWGRPDEITSTSGNDEVWIYKLTAINAKEYPR
jgi:hypothetical protein